MDQQLYNKLNDINIQFTPQINRLYNKLRQYQKQDCLFILQQFQNLNNFVIEKQIQNIQKYQIDYDKDQIYRGIILGHSVGLGKTVILTFSLAVLFQQHKIRYALICIPKSIIQQWIKHCQEWIGQGIKIVEYTGNGRNLVEQIGINQQAIVITTYQTASRDYQKIQSQMMEINQNVIQVEKIKKTRLLMQQKELQDKQNERNQILQQLQDGMSPINNEDQFQISDISQDNQITDNQQYKQLDCLDFDRNCAFDIGVFDEFQYTKNSQTEINQNLSKISFFFKIGLTGTPLMNNIKEVYNLIQFLNPQYLGCKQDFIQTVAKPIENGRIKNASEHNIINGKLYEKLLDRELKKIMIRRTEDQVKNLSINKTEIIIWFNMSDLQETVYQNFMYSKSFQTERKNLQNEKIMPFQLISILRKTCENIMKLNKNDASYLDQDVRQRFTEQQQLYIQQIQDSINITDFLRETYEQQTQQQYTQLVDSQTSFSTTTTNNTLSQYFNQLQSKPQIIEEKLHELHKRYATKQFLLIEMLKEFVKKQIKVLIFAEHTTMLDLIQLELVEADIKLLRLDGSISKTSERDALCKKFNQDKSITVFLMTITAGGVGLNLQSASRVIILSPCWGPAIEEQAIGRAYRIGQQNDVIVYKFVTRNSIEEKMVARQFHKLQVANAVTHDKHINIKAQQSDINSLFVYRDPQFEVLSKQQQEQTVQNLQNQIDENKQRIKQLETQYQQYCHSDYDAAVNATKQQQMLNNLIVEQQQRLERYQSILDSLENQLNNIIPFQQNCPTEAKDLINYMSNSFKEYKISGSILRTTASVQSQQQLQNSTNDYINDVIQERYQSIIAAENQLFDQDLTDLQNSEQQNLYRLQTSVQLGGYRTIKQLRYLGYAKGNDTEKQKHRVKQNAKQERVIKELDDLFIKQNIKSVQNKQIAKQLVSENKHKQMFDSELQSSDEDIHPFQNQIQPIIYQEEEIHPFVDQIRPIQTNYQKELYDIFNNDQQTDNQMSSSTQDYKVQNDNQDKSISISSSNSNDQQESNSTISIS